MKTLNENQVKFIEWICTNKLNELTGDQVYVVKLVINENPQHKYHTYSENSLFQERLNEVREKYMKEYAQTR